MKHKRYIFLLIAAVAFIIQLIDIVSYTIKFSITQTFVLVIIQMIGLVGYAYGARNVVKNKRAQAVRDLVQPVFSIYKKDFSCETSRF